MTTPQLVVPEPEPEHDWTERIRDGDEAAFEAMFHAYYGPLCDFVDGHVRDPAATEELVQDVFLQLWARRSEWDVRGSLRAYLYGAARNRALNHLKRRGLERRWSVVAERQHELVPHGQGPRSPEDDLRSREISTAVERVIERLPERARLAATLRWQHQLSYAEIADVMGISAKGVENQLGRAAKILRKSLSHLLF
jgi:RNA polymerase sigma-70 factor, ECF subfamily